MMRRLHPCDRSCAWLALYCVGLVCVLSFVFFELLDVDGSDFETQNFKTQTVPVSADLHRSTAEFVRRVVQHRPVLSWLAVGIDVRSVAVQARSADWSHPTFATVVVGCAHRIALPRASLEAAPPA